MEEKPVIARIFELSSEAGAQIPPASTAPRPHLRQGIYLIPTLITLGNMSMGFFSLVRTMTENFTAAATAIIIGNILDVLDGRVARWTGTASRFGVEIDSFSDWMTFCVAPAFLMYKMVLIYNHLWGFPLALLFVICGALRLARFNLKVQTGSDKSAYFTGLPTPAAGAVLASFALLYEIQALGKPVRTINIVMNRVPLFYQFVPAIMLVLSLLMVSGVRYSTMKNFNLLRPKSMMTLIMTILVILMISVFPQNMIFIFYSSYILWGLMDYFLRWSRIGKILSRKPESGELS